MRAFLFALLVVAGCTKAGSKQESPPGAPTPIASDPGGTPTGTSTPPVTPPKAMLAQVELTAVTLADDCGGTPPQSAPPPTATPPAPKPASAAKGDMSSGGQARMERAKRRCEQTSMQLAITASDASAVRVKSVELYDDSGTLLGKLTASKPTRWSDSNGIYEPWDEKVVAGSTTMVSYVLEQPAWDRIGDRWNKTFTLKTVLSVGGADQPVQRDVTLEAQTSLPPNVRT